MQIPSCLFCVLIVQILTLQKLLTQSQYANSHCAITFFGNTRWDAMPFTSPFHISLLIIYVIGILYARTVIKLAITCRGKKLPFKISRRYCTAFIWIRRHCTCSTPTTRPDPCSTQPTNIQVAVFSDVMYGLLRKYKPAFLRNLLLRISG
jgi:hypothetical protein